MEPEASIKRYISSALSFLPLSVEHASWRDEVLELAGNQWSLAATCAWRVTASGRLLYGWESIDAEMRVSELIGCEIVAISSQSEAMPSDPRFTFSSGLHLELFSGQHLEPWISSLPDSVTYVASPGEVQ